MFNKKTLIMLILRAICLIIFPLSFFIDPNYCGEITHFTVQSNILILVVMVIFSLFDILSLLGKHFEIPKFLMRLKLVATTAITVTFVVFGIILTPVLLMDGLSKVVLSYSSIVMHQVIPLIALLDWIFQETDDHFGYGNAPIALGFPVYYFILTLVLANFSNVTYPTYFNGDVVDSKFPYFFLDYQTNSWFKITPAEHISDYKIGVFYWLVFISIIISLISFLLILVKNLQFRYGKKNTRI